MAKFIRGAIFAFGVFGIILANSVENYKHGDVTPRDFITDIINSTINKVVSNLSDPITIDSITLDLSNVTDSSGSANITNVNLSGIHSFVAPTISLDFLTLNLNMTVQLTQIKLSLDYDADVLLGALLPFYGDGNVEITFDDINVQISGAANTTDGIVIHNLTLGLNIGSAKFDIEGLLDNEELSLLVTTILNDNLVDFINTYHDGLSHLVSPVVETIINTILGANKNSTVNTAEDVYNLIMMDETLNTEVFKYFHVENNA